MCSSRGEFTVIRLNAFENCLLLSPPSTPNKHDNQCKTRTLAPKIKLNKSLFSASFFSFSRRCHYHHHLVYISLAANRRRIFSRFSTSMVFCCRKDNDRKIKECCCERTERKQPRLCPQMVSRHNHIRESLKNYFVWRNFPNIFKTLDRNFFSSSKHFYCSSTHFLFMMLLYGS